MILLTQICIHSTLACCDLQKCSLFGTHSTVFRSRTSAHAGHLWLKPPSALPLLFASVLLPILWTHIYILKSSVERDMTTRWPPTLTILYMYCTVGTECHSHTPGSHSVCVVRTPLGVDWKIFSSGKKPMLSGFPTLNAQSTLPHTGNEWN